MTQYNNVNNQQGAKIFRLLIFLSQPYVFRATNSPILRSTSWLYIQLLVQCTDTAADRCHGWDGTEFHLNRDWHQSATVSVCCTKSCIYIQTVLLRMDEFVARNTWGWFKKINKRKSCYTLLVTYIVVLKWCTVTQTSVQMTQFSKT
jgi:hypothetical protein